MAEESKPVSQRFRANGSISAFIKPGELEELT